MPNYRRHRVEGNLHDCGSDLLIAEIDALRSAVRATRARHPFHIDAWVVLPRTDGRRASLLRKREAGVWQRRYWEHTIRDDQDYAAHMDYILSIRSSTHLRHILRTGRFRA